MDAFRRLRYRRKSKGQADSFTSFADAESTYNRSGSSAWQTSTARSSATVSRPSDAEKKISHDQMGQPTSPIDLRPPGSSGRMHPMLVGISRPQNIGSRPNTAGSFQNALDRAAEAVNGQARLSQSPTSQLGLRTGRYIDILAISGTPAKQSATFNEDIAERNLDTIALTIEEQHYRYEPSSKYQEEVAARNAHQIAAQRTSSIRPPVATDHTRVSEDWSPRSGSYTHRNRVEVDTAKARQSQDLPAYHSRQHSTRRKDGPGPLPAIPQERSSEDFGHMEPSSRARVKEAEMEMENAKARWLEVRRHNVPDQTPKTDKPLPASPRHQDDTQNLKTPIRSSVVTRTTGLLESQHIRTPGDVQAVVMPSDFMEAHPLPEYKPNTLQAHGNRPDRRSANTNITNSSEESRRRSDLSTGLNDRRSTTSDMSRRVKQRRPSVTSDTSTYKRVMVGNRTIMDLTTEDDADDVETASYLQTPVIEDARADAFQRAIPTVVDHYSPPQAIARDSIVPNARWSSALEPVLDLDQLARQSQMISDTAKAAAAARGQIRSPEVPRSVTPPPSSLAFSAIRTMAGASPPKTIAFSAISTLTSITPRSSTEALFADSSQKENHGSAHIGHGQRGVKGKAPEKPVVDSSSARPNARLSADIAPLMRVFADIKPDSNVRKDDGEQIKETHAELSTEKSSKDKTVVAKRNERRREKMAQAEAIREAAKKKIPAGPLDQEPLPGVKTRDFALTPIEKPTNKRIEALSERKKPQVVVKKPSTDRSSSSKSSSGEKKSRGRSIKTPNKVTFDDASVSNPIPILQQKATKEVEKQPSKKNGKSSATRKARPVSIFDEEAFQKKHAQANAALLRLQQSLQQNLDDDSSRVQTPVSRETSVERALSPTDSVARGKSPITQPSPSAAAIAMIATATSSSRTQNRPALSSNISSESNYGAKGRSDTSPLNKAGFLPTAMNTGIQRSHASTLNPLQSHVETDSKPLPSPGEVSLSAFPIPTPRTLSPESTKSPPAYVKDIGGPVRRGSQASRLSSSSAFSIPFTMVPNRMGSLPENRLGVPGPSNPPSMQSIDSIIPPSQPIDSL